MADYAACNNDDCLRKASCCRYLMVPDEYRQAYLIIEGDGEDCREYWPLEDGAPFRLLEIKGTPWDAARAVEER